MSCMTGCFHTTDYIIHYNTQDGKKERKTDVHYALDSLAIRMDQLSVALWMLTYRIDNNLDWCKVKLKQGLH